MKEKTVLLCASYSIIEPLGLFHLSSVARQEGWTPHIILGQEPYFNEIIEAAKRIQPGYLGFTIYTGNHMGVFDAFKQIRKNNPHIKIIAGGPHATYFPADCKEHADYVVLSEGFDALRHILRGTASPGVIHLKKQEDFPPAYRDDFYSYSPFHKSNPIKNVMTQTGCPFRCSYCYNSSDISVIKDSLTDQQFQEMESVLGKLKRLFPKSNRSVDAVIDEINDIMKLAPDTKMIYFQDDNFGSDVNWLKEFVKKYNHRLPFHVNMRFELANPRNERCRERMEIMRQAGCNGISFAVESADSVVRKEVLDRPMKQDLIIEAIAYLSELGYAVRTFNILGLPLGATSAPTKIGLEADLENLEFNIQLRSETGLPTIAWASTLAPYRGTRIFDYCETHGFYLGDTTEMTHESYRIRSLLRFPKKWVGPSLSADSDVWMSDEELEIYKNQLSVLMHVFQLFARDKEGLGIARRFMQQKEITFASLNRAARDEIYDHELFQTK